MEAIKRSNSIMYEKLVGVLSSNENENEYNSSIRNQVLTLKKVYEASLKKISPFGFMITMQKQYDLAKIFEAGLSKLEHKYYLNMMSTYGYKDGKRLKDNINDSPELYNRYSNFAGGIIRTFGSLFLPLPEPLWDEVRKKYYYECEDEKLYTSHSNAMFELIEPFRSAVRGILPELINQNLVRKDAEQVLTTFIWNIMRGPATWLYAGLKQGKNINIPLNNRPKSMNFRLAISDLQKKAKEQMKHMKKSSFRITTVSQLLDEESNHLITNQGYDEFRDIYKIRQQIKTVEERNEWWKKINLSFQKSDNDNSDCFDHLLDEYIIQIQLQRAFRLRRHGNALDRIMPRIMGLANHVSIYELLNHPERYGSVYNNYIIATEVSFYYDTLYGRIDYVIFQLVNVTDDEGEDHEILRIRLIIDRKSVTYEEFTAVGRYELTKLEKKADNLDMIKNFIDMNEPHRITAGLRTKQLPLDLGTFEIVIDETLNQSIQSVKQTRYRNQLKYYRDNLINIIDNYYKNKPVLRDVYRYHYDSPFVGILLSDSFYHTSRELKQLAHEEINIMLGFLIQLQEERIYNISTGTEFNQTYTFEVGEMEGNGNYDPSYNATRLVVSTLNKVDPSKLHYFYRQQVVEDFTSSMKEVMSFANKWITIWYSVPNPHPSNQHITYLTGYEQILTDIQFQLKRDSDISSKVLLLDISGYLEEFRLQRLFRFVSNHPLIKFVSNRVEIKSKYLPDKQFYSFEESSYSHIIVIGLDLLQFLDGTTLTIYRRQLVAALRPLTKSLHLVLPPFYLPKLDALLQINKILPYSKQDLEGNERYLVECSRIVFNLPFPPHSLLKTQPRTDRYRIVVEYWLDQKRNRKSNNSYFYSSRIKSLPKIWKKSKKEMSFSLFCSSSIGEISCLFDNSQQGRKLSKKAEKINHSISYDEVKGLYNYLSFFKDYNHYETHEISPVIPHIFRRSKETETKSNLFVFNPDLKVSKSKYESPLQPGRYRAYRPRSRDKTQRNRYTYSTKTPKLEYFDLSRRGYYNKNRSANLVRWVFHYLKNPSLLNYFQSTQLAKKSITKKNPNSGFQVETKSEIMYNLIRNNEYFIKSFIDQDYEGKSFYEDYLNNRQYNFDLDPNNVISRIHTSTIKFGTIQDSYYMEELHHNLTNDFSFNNPYNSHSQKTYNAWLLVVIRLIWNSLPHLQVWHVFQLAEYLKPWLAVQIELSVDNRQNVVVPAETFVINVNRIITSGFNFATSLLIQQARYLHYGTSKYAADEILSGRICYFDSGILFHLSNKTDDYNRRYVLQYSKQYHYNNKLLGKFPILDGFPGSISELEGQHQSHVIIAINIQSKTYLLRLDHHQDVWKSIGELIIDEKYTIVIRIKPTNFPDLHSSYYNIEIEEDTSFDHSGGKEEIYFPKTLLTVTSTDDYYFDSKPNDNQANAIDYQLIFIGIADMPLKFQPNSTEELLEIIFANKTVLPEDLKADDPNVLEYISKEIQVKYQNVSIIPPLTIEKGIAEFAWISTFINRISHRSYLQQFYPEYAIDLVLEFIKPPHKYLQINISHESRRDIVYNRQIVVETHGINLDDESGNIHLKHKDCFIIEIDDTKLFQVLQFNFPGFKLQSGFNYLTGHQLSFIISNEYLMDDKNEKYMLNVNFLFDQNDKMILQEDKFQLMNIAKRKGVIPLSAKRLEYNSYLAHKDLEFVECLIDKNQFTIYSRFLGSSNIKPISIVKASECELVETLSQIAENDNFEQVLPSPERFVNVDDGIEESRSMILIFVNQHLKKERCRKKIHSKS